MFSMQSLISNISKLSLVKSRCQTVPLSQMVRSFSVSQSDHSQAKLMKFPYKNPSELYKPMKKWKPTDIDDLTTLRTPYYIQKMLNRVDRVGAPPSKMKPNALGRGVAARKGLVKQLLIKKPKKPNSACRKCVLVHIASLKPGATKDDYKKAIAYVPGEGHKLQENNIVIVTSKKLKDTPGVYLRCVRGRHDLPNVIKKRRE